MMTCDVIIYRETKTLGVLISRGISPRYTPEKNVNIISLEVLEIYNLKAHNVIKSYLI